MDRSIKLIFLKLLPILLLLWPTTALAGIFDPPVTDLSIQYLGTIFGGSVGSINLGTSTASNPFLGSLFQAFNGVVLSISVFILSYVSSIAIINTAHQGEAMGKKWSSVWIPLRSMSGLLLLAPIPGSGYSLLQVTVMWIIINGIGAADVIWNLAVSNLAQGISPVQSAQINGWATAQLKNNAKTFGPAILQNLVCLQVVKNNIDTDLLSATNNSLDVFYTSGPGTNAGSIHFGVQDLSNPNNTSYPLLDICGKVSFSGIVSSGELPGANSQQARLIATNAYQIKKEALSSMMPYLQYVAADIAGIPASGNTVTLPSDLSAGELFPAVAIFQKTLSSLTKQAALVKLGLGTSVYTTSVDSLVTSNVYTAQSKGWITAGSFYYLLNKSATQSMLNTATDSIMPIGYKATFEFNIDPLRLTSPGPSLHDLVQPYITAMNGNWAIASLFNDPFDVPPSAGIYFNQMPDPVYIALAAISPVGAIALGVAESIQAMMGAFINQIMNDYGGDPLINHAQAGATMMYAAEIAIVGFIMGSLALTIGAAVCSAEFPMAAMIAEAVITIMIPLMTVLGLIWVLGATLSIYLPMVPYMMFAITALSWLMLVIEAVVAAPIVALGLVTPAQDELGKLEHALGMITSIFLRPLLMVVGLIMSSKIFSVMLQFVSYGFAESMGIVLNQSDNKSLFACVPVTVLYAGFVIALENKCFSLIYQLPDKILKWIGVQGESTDMSALQETKGAFEAHAKQGIQPLQGSATGIMEKEKEGLGELGGGGGGGKKGGG